MGQQFQSLSRKISMLRLALLATLALAAATAAEDCMSDAGQKCMSKCEIDAATGSTGKFDYMFEEGGDPCFLHDGEGMCVYAEDDTILIGKCDTDAAGCNAGGACDRQDLTGTGSGY